jgi:hypothetical protein
MTANQREFTRVPIHIQAIIQGDGQTIAGSGTENVSLKGLLVGCGETLPEGSNCRITLLLAGGQVRIEADATVVRAYENGLACQFTRILGAESYEHLRKLVLYNAPDPEQIEDEFSHHVGLKKR